MLGGSGGTVAAGVAKKKRIMVETLKHSALSLRLRFTKMAPPKWLL